MTSVAIVSPSSDGTAIATNGTTNVKWSWPTENSSSGMVALIPDVGITSLLDELNDDWKIVESTGVRIKLEHVSGGSGDTEI